MDFYEIKERALKSGTTEVRPAWRVQRFKDLMVRGKSFYAVYNPETHFWSTDEYDLVRIVDADVARQFQEASERIDGTVWPRYLGDYDSKTYTDYKSWMSKLPDSHKPLDSKILFANQIPRREDYVTGTLSYSLSDNSCPDEHPLQSGGEGDTRGGHWVHIHRRFCMDSEVLRALRVVGIR